MQFLTIILIHAIYVYLEFLGIPEYSINHALNCMNYKELCLCHSTINICETVIVHKIIHL